MNTISIGTTHTAADSLSEASHSHNSPSTEPSNMDETSGVETPVVNTAENIESMDTDEALFLEASVLDALDLNDESHLQMAMQYLAQAFNVSLTLGIMLLFQYPALKQACQRLMQDYEQAIQTEHAEQQGQRRLAQRSVLDISSDAVLATSTSTSLAATGLGLLPQAIQMPHVQRSLAGFSSFTSLLYIPHLLKKAWNAGSLALRTAVAFLNRDADFENEINRRVNPANYFVQDVVQKEGARGNVNRGVSQCIGGLTSSICLLAGMGLFSVAAEAGVREGVNQILNQGDNAATDGDDRYQLEQSLVPLIAELVSNLNADDMKTALLELGPGNYVQWQLGGARYSDDEEMAFLNHVIWLCANKNSDLVSHDDCTKAYDAIDDIYCDCEYPEFAILGEDGYVKNSDLRQFLVLIRELRKLDIPAHGNRKRTGGPLGENNNHVFRHAILPILQANAINVHRINNSVSAQARINA